MNQTQRTLSTIWDHFQEQLLPFLEETLGYLSEKQEQLVRVIELASVERHLPYIGCAVGRPEHCRSSLARAFIAKSVYTMPTTEVLIERLQMDKTLRRICGWERLSEIPSQPTFSRAFSEFSSSRLPEYIHESLVTRFLGDQLVGHLSRDSTAIDSRESVVKRDKPDIEEATKRKRGRPKKGEVVEPKKPTRIERQSSGMSLSDMIDELPTDCDKGAKRNAQGYKISWKGYKLHIDSTEQGIPVSCLLTSASMHDSQAAIPLAMRSNQRVSSCYELMDAAYDSDLIKGYIQSLGHVPLIDENPHTSERKQQIEQEALAQKNCRFKYPENQRYNNRSSVERVNGRLKDEFGARMVPVKGHAKVMTHLMFGVIVLTVDQLMRLIE